ncbi:UDP-N-acetylglucosamine 2-epimerase (non-hydrolyzing), partial [bacterium]|nr:UDP-N-acetylglucosamine 2-epimerase (non-hydrolyzing) [bacterium]
MNNKHAVLVALGTRPEAIKLAPIIKALETSEQFTPIVVATAQHRNMLDQVLNFFEITPQYDLDLMKPNQDLYYTTSECLMRMKNVLRDTSPEMIIVQGDTTTALSAALAAFYQRVPIAHVEAGLRTFQKYS